MSVEGLSVTEDQSAIEDESVIEGPSATEDQTSLRTIDLGDRTTCDARASVVTCGYADVCR